VCITPGSRSTAASTTRHPRCGRTSWSRKVCGYATCSVRSRRSTAATNRMCAMGNRDGAMRTFKSKHAFAVGAQIAHQALWYAAPAQAQAEGAGETYEECVERVQSVKQRRRAGRSVGTRLADAECAPLRDVQVVEEGGAAPVEGAPAQRTRIAPGAAYGMPRSE